MSAERFPPTRPNIDTLRARVITECLVNQTGGIFPKWDLRGPVGFEGGGPTMPRCPVSVRALPLGLIITHRDFTSSSLRRTSQSPGKVAASSKVPSQRQVQCKRVTTAVEPTQSNVRRDPVWPVPLMHAGIIPRLRRWILTVHIQTGYKPYPCGNHHLKFQASCRYHPSYC